MAYEHWVLHKFGPGGHLNPEIEFERLSFSNKVGKRVDKGVQSPHVYAFVQATQLETWGAAPSDPGQVGWALNQLPTPSAAKWVSAENAALSKWYGTVRKGNAELGVTLASWRQSRDMMVSRLSRANAAVERSATRLANSRTMQARVRRTLRLDTRSTAERRFTPLASSVLEVEFGWIPLFTDIYNAAWKVCQEVTPEYAVSRQRFADAYPGGNGSTLDHKFSFTNCLVTVAGTVRITNPNLWLANKLGLINPLTVAWDLVPWSFVVNRFVNVNQIIGSLSNEIGIDVSNRSVTRSYALDLKYRSHSNPWGYPWLPPSWGWNWRIQGKRRERSVGSFPSIKWEMKVPNLSWNDALIASSLLLQNVSKLDRLVSKILS